MPWTLEDQLRRSLSLRRTNEYPLYGRHSPISICVWIINSHGWSQRVPTRLFSHRLANLRSVRINILEYHYIAIPARCLFPHEESWCPALDSFGLIAQAVKMMKQLFMPDRPGARAELKKWNTIYQFKGSANYTTIPSRMVYFASLYSIVPSTTVLWSSSFMEVFAVYYGSALRNQCNHCQIGRLVMR